MADGKSSAPPLHLQEIEDDEDDFSIDENFPNNGNSNSNEMMERSSALVGASTTGTGTGKSEPPFLAASIDTLPIRNRIKTSQPVYLKCPHCCQFTLTTVQRRPGIKSVLSCLAVGLVAWCGCCFVPCCMRSCQDTVHSCSHCRKVIAVLERRVAF